MFILWIFLAIFTFCIYIFFGLYVTEGLESLPQLILSWVVYTVLWVTFLNVFTLGYFWSVIRTKTGPYGLRGPEGEVGDNGLQGECSINASQAYCMKSLNDYINNLYKALTNKDILNEEIQKFPCTYLNEKILKISGSRQFTVIVGNLSSDNKGISSLVNYLKTVWKTWFDLIYYSTSNPGAWFIDEFGDENYNWSGTNPFIEIRKYDIYYWGITRDFRPLKAEICRSTSNHGDSKFPQPHLPKTQDKLLEPRIKIMETNYYKYVANDWKTEASPDVSWWRPRPVMKNSETYYPVGDVVTSNSDFYWPAEPEEDAPAKNSKKGNLIQGDYNGPDPVDLSLENNSNFFQGYSYEFNDSKCSMTQDQYIRTGTGPDFTTILVAGDVVSPIGLELVKDIDTEGRFWLNHYRLKCPEGYTSMGDLTIANKFDMRHTAFENDKLKCVPIDCIEPVQELNTDILKNFFQEALKNHDNDDFGERVDKFNEEVEKGMGIPTSKWDWSSEYSNYVISNFRNTDERGIDDKASYHNGYNLFRVGPDITAPFYKFKKSCLEKTPNIPYPPPSPLPPPSTKTVEKVYSDLGIGWYGHPYKLDPKYSIFSYLNLVPEGMVVNQGSGHRFYIVHVEGEDINLFNMLTYNINTRKYDGAVQINTSYIDDPNDPNVQYYKNAKPNDVINQFVDPKSSSDIVPTNFIPIKRIIVTTLNTLDPSQQWIIILNENKKLFKLKNAKNNTYLFASNEKNDGIIDFSTIDLNNNYYLNDPAFAYLSQEELENRTNFSFISSFGTQLDIIDKNST
jgi:hypothetical protein